MTNLTRRLFLQRSPVTAATLGLLPAIPALAAAADPPDATEHASYSTSEGPLIVQVNDFRTGEMRLFVGGRAILLRDPRLVACLVEATRKGGLVKQSLV
jgi:hypothetical protein